MTERTFAQWLRGQMAEKDMSGSELARRVGVVRQSVYRWLDGTRLPEPESARRIADVLGVHVDHVFTLAGIRPPVMPITRAVQDDTLRNMQTQLQALLETRHTSGVAVPIIGTIPADDVRWVSMGAKESVAYIPEEWSEQYQFPLAAVIASGDCMLGMGIASGDIVIIERVPSWQYVRDGALVVLRIEDEYTMKRWHRVGNTIELRNGANDVVRTISILEDVELIGIARRHFGDLG